jgi:hypothetical protein
MPATVEKIGTTLHRSGDSRVDPPCDGNCASVWTCPVCGARYGSCVVREAVGHRQTHQYATCPQPLAVTDAPRFFDRYGRPIPVE